jgi:hypothetical protein
MFVPIPDRISVLIAAHALISGMYQDCLCGQSLFIAVLDLARRTGVLRAAAGRPIMTGQV